MVRPAVQSEAHAAPSGSPGSWSQSSEIPKAIVISSETIDERINIREGGG